MVLLELLGGLRKLIRVRDSADVDSPVFKLHYSITSTILLTFSLLVTTATLVGDPINCLYGSDPRLKDNVVNTYCWIHTTFTLPAYLHRNREIGYSHPHPGIGLDDRDTEKVYHAYYQWVPFILFTQALLFYAPHWLWKTCESNKVSSLTVGLINPVISTTDKNAKVEILADYLNTSLHSHNIYAIKFIMCESLNFLNCIFNIWLLDTFLGGKFFTFGLESLTFTEEDQDVRTDPLIVAFPRVTKCAFHLYGPSGTIEKIDIMCVLAVNAINEKIFIFLWFWFVALSCISGLALLYRVIALCTPILRIGLLQKKAKFKHKNVGIILNKRLHMGDFFLLNLISKNIDMPSFSAVIHAIYLHFELESSSRDLEMSAPLSEDYRLMNDCP